MCVCVCAFLCVGWYVPPEVRVDCCTLSVRVRVHVCARQRVLFDCQSPLEHAPATVSRPSRPKVTTLPRRTLNSKSARRYRQSLAGVRPATVSRPLRPKVTTLPRRTALQPEPSRARLCHGFASLETKSDDPSKPAPLPPDLPQPRFHAPRDQK